MKNFRLKPTIDSKFKLKGYRLGWPKARLTRVYTHNSDIMAVDYKYFGVAWVPVGNVRMTMSITSVVPLKYISINFKVKK